MVIVARNGRTDFNNQLLELKRGDQVVVRGTAYPVDKVKPIGREGARLGVEVYTQGGRMFVEGEISHYDKRTM